VLRRPCRPMFILGVGCGCVRDDPVTPSAYDPGRRFSQHTRMSMRHASPCDQSQTAHEYAGNAAAAGVRSERPSCKRTTCTTNPMVAGIGSRSLIPICYASSMFANCRSGLCRPGRGDEGHAARTPGGHGDVHSLVARRLNPHDLIPLTIPAICRGGAGPYPIASTAHLVARDAASAGLTSSTGERVRRTRADAA
jgi:hypothetical protein